MMYKMLFLALILCAFSGGSSVKKQKKEVQKNESKVEKKEEPNETETTTQKRQSKKPSFKKQQKQYEHETKEWLEWHEIEAQKELDADIEAFQQQLAEETETEEQDQAKQNATTMTIPRIARAQRAKKPSFKKTTKTI